ncbi:MAG: hypothetical protein ABI134_10600, partial [Byssovorax sp.]
MVHSGLSRLTHALLRQAKLSPRDAHCALLVQLCAAGTHWLFTHVSEASLQSGAVVHGAAGEHEPLTHVEPAAHELDEAQAAAAQIAGSSASLLHTWPAIVHSASAAQASALVSTRSEHDVAAPASPRVAIEEKKSRPRPARVPLRPIKC